MLAQRGAVNFLHTGGAAKRQKMDGDTATVCFPGCHQAHLQESQSLSLSVIPEACTQVFASRMGQGHKRKSKVQCGKGARGA